MVRGPSGTALLVENAENRCDFGQPLLGGIQPGQFGRELDFGFQVPQDVHNRTESHDSQCRCQLSRRLKLLFGKLSLCSKLPALMFAGRQLLPQGHHPLFQFCHGDSFLTWSFA